VGKKGLPIRHPLVNDALATLLACVLSAATCKTHPQSNERDTLPGRADCRDRAECAQDEYCEFARGLWGKGALGGTCRPKPKVCPSRYEPVCACDGMAYDNECSARSAGVDLAVSGGCKKPVADWAPCGSHFCDARTSYCEIYLSDVAELPTSHRCRPLPTSCLVDSGARTCACFPSDTRCLKFCGPLGTVGQTTFHLTCQGQKDPAQ
jgi:hypothetical protein